jgi:putative ABC transport system permease protein
MYTLRQIFESLRFAAKALKSNLLRTILSLLGVTIGIFAIISVLTIGGFPREKYQGQP